MKRRQIVLAIVGALLLGFSAWAIRLSEPSSHDFVLEGAGCRTPVTVIEPFHSGSRVSAIIIHGLSANRKIMRGLATYLVRDQDLHAYLIDLPGHGDNTDPFSFVRAERCARMAVESLIRSGVADPKRTVLVGHSMGGAIVIRMADREPVAATIAISPAPMPLPRRMPVNLLVFSAQFDLPTLKNVAQTLAEAAAGDRVGWDDFLQQRAFHVQTVPQATHTSVLFDSQVREQTSDWIGDSLNAETAKQIGQSDWTNNVHWDDVTATDRFSKKAQLLFAMTLYSETAPFVGFVAILLLLPLCVSSAAKIAGPAAAELPGANPAAVLGLAQGAVGALTGALILALFIPLEFLHLYSGDYLASLMLIAAVLLLALNWKAVKQSCRLNVRALLAAAALGFAVMLGIGAWLNWQVADLWMNALRWWRFAALLPVMWVFCFAEEVMLGPVGKRWRHAARFALCLGLRAELWLACLLTYYTLASGQVLILILVASLALFSILQRLAADALRLRTGSPAAAALFGAILAAWFIAAVFPLT